MTELDDLLRASAPISDDDVARLDLSDSEPELREAIMTTPTLLAGTEPAPRPAADRPSWRRPRFLQAAAAALVVALGVTLFAQSRPGGDTAWAAPILAIAEEAPRYLVGQPGWSVSRADEFSGDTGEMTFTDGSREVDLRWIPVSELEDRVDDRRRSAEHEDAVRMPAHDAVLFRYEGTTDYTALWEDGAHGLEFRGEFATQADFEEVLTSLVEVGVDEWLSAMPESVVKPDARRATIEAMLADVPVHPTIDLDALAAGSTVSDRYQLGAYTTGAVGCAWFDQYHAALAAGDTVAADEAVAALAGASDWAIFEEMADEGAYPQVFVDYAGRMDGTPVAGVESAIGCGDR